MIDAQVLCSAGQQLPPTSQERERLAPQRLVVGKGADKRVCRQAGQQSQVVGGLKPRLRSACRRPEADGAACQREEEDLPAFPLNGPRQGVRVAECAEVLSFGQVPRPHLKRGRAELNGTHVGPQVPLALHLISPGVKPASPTVIGMTPMYLPPCDSRPPSANAATLTPL